MTLSAADILIVDGFEKYAPTGTLDVASTLAGMTAMLGNNGANINEAGQGFLLAWLSEVTSNGGAVGLFQGRAGSGTLALGLKRTGGSDCSVVRNFGANPSRIVFGAAVQSNLGGNTGINFADGGTVQSSLWINASGHVAFGISGIGGTALFTSTQTVLASTWHYLEIDLTTHNSTGAYTIWLDGAQITTASGVNTRGGTTNNYVNQVSLVAGSTSSSSGAYDDLYVLNNSGATYTALGDQTVDTLTVAADSAVQFTKQATVVGDYRQATATTSAPGANKLALKKITPAVNMTVNSIGILPAATSASAKFKGVIYSDSAGSPNALLSSGTEAVGCTSGTNLSLALVTPQALTGGTSYWIGYITDTSIVIQQADNITANGQSATNTYASGAPGTAPAMTTAQPCWAIWGNCTLSASNYAQVNQAPGPISQGTALAYNQDSTVGHEDLFTVSSLPVTPAAINAVVVNVMASKSDSGARTLGINCKSVSTDSASSAITIGTSMQWYANAFPTDPATGVAWVNSGVNAMKIGYDVAS